MLIRRKYFKMFAALSLFSSVCGYASSSTSTTKEGLSVREMRKQCETLQEGSQTGVKEIIIHCHGMRVVADRTEDSISKANSVNYYARASIKSGDYQTSPFELDKDLEPMNLQCAKVDLKTISAPVGGVKTSVNSCAEITEENIERLCAQEIPNYCRDNMVDLSAPNEGEAPVDTTGMCTTDHLTTIDTCSYYR